MLLALRAEGHTHFDIARSFKVDINTIGRRLRDLSSPIPRRVQAQPPPAADVEIPVHVAELDDLPAMVEAPQPPTPPPAPEWQVSTATREHALQQQLHEIRRQNAKLLGELQDREEQIGVVRALREAQVQPIVGKPRTHGSKRHGVPVMLISDLHVEEPVRPETVNGLNEYNLEIAATCIDEMASAYSWMLQDSRFDCREGVVWLGGDLFSNFIHEELQEQNLLSPVEAIVWLHKHIVAMFDRILAETQLERIIVPCNDGNHGRLTHRMRIATRTKNSLEWLLYQQLARHYANEPRLQFQIAEGVSNYLDIYGTSICFQHGDTFKYQGGVGGLLIPVRRGFNEIRKYRKVDHLVIGHFHQRLDAGDVIVNGSGIGINAYGMSIKATPEPRQQSWFLIDQEHGKAISAPIWLPNTATKKAS